MGGGNNATKRNSSINAQVLFQLIKSHGKKSSLEASFIILDESEQKEAVVFLIFIISLLTESCAKEENIQKKVYICDSHGILINHYFYIHVARIMAVLVASHSQQAGS